MAKLFLDGTKLSYHLEEVNKWLKGEFFPPIHIEIGPTSACNHKCFFCYVDFKKNSVKTMKREVLLKLIESCRNIGIKSALLAGDGEPLVNKHTVDAIELAGRIGLDIALNSNGVLITPEIAKRILPNLVWMRVSVMSNESESYSRLHGTDPQDFKKLIQNLKFVAQYKKENNLKVTLGIQQVLIKENGHTVAELARLTKEIGFDYYVLKPFHLHNKNVYDTSKSLYLQFKEVLREAEKLTDDKFSSIVRWNIFEDMGKRNYAKCLGLPFIIQTSGDSCVYTCCPFYGQKEFCYGDLNEQSLEEILTSPRYREIHEKVMNIIDVQKCMSYCRHHNVNKYLWSLTHPPAHLNFI